MGKIAEFLRCLWLFLTESANLLLHGHPPGADDLDEFIADRTEENPDFPSMVKVARKITIEGNQLKECPNCRSRDLAIHKGFTYVWCHSCGMNGPCSDGHPYDAVLEWNKLPRKGDDPGY
jgi:ribosomal protein L37AE/L43A